MCLTALAIKAGSEFPVVVAFNRDERLLRETQVAHEFSVRRVDGQGGEEVVVGGRDAEAGGTWLGLAPRTGRVALLTNVTEEPSLAPTNPPPPSRGGLVTDFLASDASPDAYCRGLQDTAGLERFRGFNLVVGVLDTVAPTFVWLTNRADGAGVSTRSTLLGLDPGATVHHLSNHGPLDSVLPKGEALAECVGDAVRRADADPKGELDVERILRTCASTEGFTTFATQPATCPKEEDPLSRIFVVQGKGGGYGTRTSTVIALHRTGRIDFYERTHGEDAVRGPCKDVPGQVAFTYPGPAGAVDS